MPERGAVRQLLLNNSGYVVVHARVVNGFSGPRLLNRE